MQTSILKIFFVFLVIPAISQIYFSQESGSPQETNLPQETEARLIDKFGILGCEDIWVRQDYFFIAIHNSPNSIGYAVIYGIVRLVASASNPCTNNRTFISIGNWCLC